MDDDEKTDLTEILRQLLDHESPHIRSRAQIVLMSLEGRSAEEIALETHLSERTVHKWVKAWAADGMAIFPTHDISEETPPPVTDESPTLILPKFIDPPPSEPGILVTDSLAEAARKTFYFQFQQMLFQYAAIAGHDPVEGVHRMRVAIRRMRSAYRLFDGILTSDYYGKLPRRLRHTARLLGQVRDLDVARIKTEAYITDVLHGDGATLTPLLEKISERRQAALHELSGWFGDARFAKFLTRLAKAVESPTTVPDADALPTVAYQVKHVLPRLIYTQWEAVARFDTVIEHANTTTLHALRIEFKRLRYTLEFFEEVLGPSLKLVIKEIKAMQDHLGDLNDAEVAAILLRDLQKDLKKSHKQAVEDYRAAREAEATRLKDGTPAAWANFNRPAVHEALAQAIGVL